MINRVSNVSVGKAGFESFRGPLAIRPNRISDAFLPFDRLDIVRFTELREINLSDLFDVSFDPVIVAIYLHGSQLPHRP